VPWHKQTPPKKAARAVEKTKKKSRLSGLRSAFSSVATIGASFSARGASLNSFGNDWAPTSAQPRSSGPWTRCSSLQARSPGCHRSSAISARRPPLRNDGARVLLLILRHAPLHRFNDGPSWQKGRSPSEPDLDRGRRNRHVPSHKCRRNTWPSDHMPTVRFAASFLNDAPHGTHFLVDSILNAAGHCFLLLFRYGR